MNISKAVEVELADEAPKIINGYWHEWIDGEWVNTGVKAEGKGIFKITDYYGVSLHKDVFPSKWDLEIPIKLSNEYLWNYEEIIYTDGTYASTKKRIIQGKDAKSIQSVKNAYAYSSSDTKSPTSGWMSTIASLGAKPEGYFLWVRDDITYSDGTSSSTVGYVVKDGEKGEDGKSISISASATSVKMSKTGVPSPLEVTVKAFASKTSISSWLYSLDNSSFTTRPYGVRQGIGDVVFVDNSKVNYNNTLSIKVSDGTLEDTVTISKTYDGDDGQDGYNTATISLYKRSAETPTPSKPTGTFRYKFDDAQFWGKVGSDFNRWSVDIPRKVNNFPLWEIKGKAISKTNYADINSWSDPKILAEDGLPGSQGLPGQIPVQKEWVVGDAHRNTDEIVDFIYVRGKDKDTSYWYKKKHKGIVPSAGTPPQNGIVPDDYEIVSWLNELAVKILIAEEGNLANFIFKEDKLLSIRGKTFAGQEIDYGDYTEYEFTDRTSPPSPGSSYWTNVPSGTIRFVRFKKNTETDWTVKTIGTYGDRWTVKFASSPDSLSWYNSYNIGRDWMQIKEAEEVDFRDAVKINLSDGYDFIPNIIIDGARGTVRITGEINATSGNIAGLIIEQNKLLSKNRRIEIDGENNIIALKDENLNVRTIIHPNDIVSIDNYFDTGSNYNADLSTLNTNYLSDTVSKSLTIGGSSSDTHELTISGFNIEAIADMSVGARPDAKVESSTWADLLKDGKPIVRLCTATAICYGEIGYESSEAGMSAKTFSVSGGSTYTIEISNSALKQEDQNAETYGKISGLSTMTTGKVVNRSEIGNNGTVTATSSLNYTYDVGNLFQVRRGNTGFRVTPNGVQKSTNMWSTNPTWSNI